MRGDENFDGRIIDLPNWGSSLITCLSFFNFSILSPKGSPVQKSYQELGKKRVEAKLIQELFPRSVDRGE